MKIEILLKEIREEKRINFKGYFKNDRNINITFKLYREKRERAIFVNGYKDCKGIKYKNRRLIQNSTITVLFIFAKENTGFVKYPP